MTSLVPTHAGAALRSFIDDVMDTVAVLPRGTDLWDVIRADCESVCSAVSLGKGTLAQAIEWETLKLRTRLAGAEAMPFRNAPPLFRNRHVHVGMLIRLWRALALETEAWLADQGYETLLDVGPWGGFNFVLEPDGYTRMPFARLTLAVGGLPATPLYEQGGPLFDYMLPRYRAELGAAGVAFPDVWTYQFPKRDATGRLLEISGTHYLPSHSYDRRTFVKVRASRACETVEEIALRDFLILLERLQFTSDWVLYREQTKDVDARFDLQDFISLNHMVEGIYQRTAAEDRLLHEIKDAFRGAVRAPQVLHHYLGQVVTVRWVENLYWALAEAALGVKRYQRMVSFDREVCTRIPPRLLIPVRRHLETYHGRLDPFDQKSELPC
ncbi:MAG: hypothetical protein GDA66_17710 [Nitrospira sp. CR1.2]|nr:hypothetical protein [Nitrospira sp. CR1.2]